MKITFEVPDELAAALGITSPEELSRRALESLILQAYRTDRISAPEAANTLSFSRMRWEQFLEDHRVFEHSYTVDDLERDVATLRSLRAAGRLAQTE